MWILKGPNDEVYYLLPGKHIVGRRNCDLILNTDQSISRAHAVIEVSHSQNNWSNPTETPVVDLSDSGSKYGTTFVTGNNTVKVEKDEKKNLKAGDVIHFGVQFNNWRLCYEPLVVVVSSLSKAEKQKVRSLIGELGGFVVTEWHPQTSHLTMARVTMTVKAISALAHAKPIVTPQYWLSYKTAIMSKVDLPKCEDYVPPIGETVLNEHEVSFLVNSKRKILFNGNTFYFFSELQFKDHGCMVQAAGGVAKLVRAVRHSQMKHFVEPDAIAMQLLSTNSQSQCQTPEAFTEVCDFVKSHGKRLIPASEIGLAVLHCSVEKYCNPDFSFASMLLRNSQDTQPVIHERILATETQESTGSSEVLVGDRKVIPDSGSESKIGLSLSVDGSSVAAGTKSTQKLLQESQQATQIASQIRASNSQSQSQGPNNRSIFARSSKRVRVMDESDDEVDILSPRKLPAGAVKGPRKPPTVTIEDSNSDVETYNIPASASNSRISRLNISRTSHYSEDSDDPEQLFADFKESQPNPRKSLQRPESPDMDADDLLANFQDDIRPSCGQQVAEPHKSLQFKATVSESPACKRVLSSDDESDSRPEKRFAKLDLSRLQDSADQKNSETEEQYMSTKHEKREVDSFDAKPYNESIVFKCLMIRKSKNNSVTISGTFDTTDSVSSVVNYKKFKKVNSLSTSLIPRIIGGRDLQPYQSTIHNGSINHADMSDDDEEEEGPNTLWGSLTQKNSWKNNRSRKL